MSNGAKQRPWHRRPKENSKAHELFLIYLSLGSSRTIKKLSDHTQKSYGTLTDLSAKFEWPKRADAYDEWILTVQENAIQRTLQKDAILYAQRRSQYRDREYKLAESLLEKAEEMNEAPLYEDLITDSIEVQGVDGPITVPVAITRIPVRWSCRDALAYARTASEIMRLSLEMETSRVGHINLDDPAVRLERAKAALEKLRADIDKLVSEQLAMTPGQNPEQVRLEIWEKLPKWVSIDWNLEQEQVALLTEGDGVLPLPSGELPHQPENEFAN